MSPGQLIAFVNALTLGDLEALRHKLAQAGAACLDLGQPELAQRLEEARAALVLGDVKTYRKRLETVVARLGHLR